VPIAIDRNKGGGRINVAALLERNGPRKEAMTPVMSEFDWAGGLSNKENRESAGNLSKGPRTTEMLCKQRTGRGKNMMTQSGQSTFKQGCPNKPRGEEFPKNGSTGKLLSRKARQDGQEKDSKGRGGKK